MQHDLPHVLRTRGDLPRSEILRLGHTDRDLSALLRHGAIERIGRATYGLPRPDLRPEERHIRTTRAVLHRYAGRAVASHHSALALAGLPLHDVPWDEVHVTALHARSFRRRSDHVLHAADVSTRHGAHPAHPHRVTLADALVQTGKQWGPGALLVPADQALRRTMLTVDELAAAVKRYAHAPGLTQVKAAVALVDPLAESPGESLLRWVLHQLGHVTRAQVDAGLRHRVCRIDLVIEGTRIALEFDGMGKYELGPSGNEHTRQRLLRAEKARDEDLRAAGWYVVHVTWPELFHPEVIARRIEAARTWSARAM
ncbi:hypothetical protein KEM60_01480 [Austwickia sp. TVS 96-490-7B]|uniref:hypothetical protein n=1 Tax=Austwickia sp. TVS 96-490-7B TaxID=2830843 RepID=UPI001C5673E7|nr:hypothetical protein [Austwickia sp. TVS 96-490-7B]MBW3085283.1 hypothetical protein [Austwickia sp. TVS 96-490-7B]